MTDLDTHTTVEPDTQRGRRLHPAHIAFAVALALLIGAVGVLIGQRTATDRTLADPVSIGFARDMQTHHAQAVAMSAPMHRRSDDPELNFLAFDIMTTQQGQIGIMNGWLDLADPDQVDGETMAWMGGEHSADHSAAARMPGMATDEQVASLGTLPLPQATEQFLRLMIRHHAGALPMALYAAQNAEHPEVRLLAQNMYDGQASEIELLQKMLIERGHAAEPTDVAGASADGQDGADEPTAETGHSGSHG